MEDWGPGSKYTQIASFDISKSTACGSGVIITVDLGQNREERLRVERSAMTIGEPPWRGSPTPSKTRISSSWDATRVDRSSCPRGGVRPALLFGVPFTQPT